MITIFSIGRKAFPMAQKVEVKLIDDLDGGPADEVVSFALDGVMYEIDLSTANAKQFREAFAQYLDVSRKVRSARKAVRRVPENVNVVAAVSLSGIGLDRTIARVVADPTVTHNTHEVDASGTFGTLHLEVRNVPGPNPKTGLIVAPSVAGELVELRGTGGLPRSGAALRLADLGQRAGRGADVRGDAVGSRADLPRARRRARPRRWRRDPAAALPLTGGRAALRRRRQVSTSGSG